MSALASRPKRAAGEFAMPPAFTAFDQAGQPALTRDLADEIVQRLAPMLRGSGGDGWMTTREAADYLSMSVAALHRLTSAREVPFAQDAPGGKCWFRRSDLDAWRYH